MRYGKMVSSIWLLASLFCLNNAFAQSLQEPCDSHPDLLLDEKGKPVRVKASELMKRIIHCEAPRLPGNVCAKGNVIVQVLITPEGKVECAKAITGHPVMNMAAIEAIKKWTFKPMIVNGKPVAFLGILPVLVSWNFQEAEKQCKTKK